MRHSYTDYYLTPSLRRLESYGLGLYNFRGKKWNRCDGGEYPRYISKRSGSYRIFAYINGITSCCNKCSFCRLSEMKEQASTFNKEHFLKFYHKYGPYIRTYTFGGGEPLMYMQDILDLFLDPKVFEYPCSRAIITSAPRDLFFKWYNWEREPAPFLESSIGEFIRFILPIDLPWSIFERYVDILYISRHHWDDEKNQKSFNSSVPLLTLQDISTLPDRMKSKITFAVTCYNGENGIHTVNDIKKMIRAATSVGVSKIIFNDLEYGMTDKAYYRKNQIASSLFEEAKKELKKLGFRHNYDRDIAFSGGYHISTYFSSHTIVSFKEYSNGSQWTASYRRTFDLSLLPNGTIQYDKI